MQSMKKNYKYKNLKNSIMLIAGLMMIIAAFCQTDISKQKRLKCWQDARFGMFIHWGPASIKGTEISGSRGKEWPVEEYDALYKQFNPLKFNALEWLRIAKAAGMKYIVFTSKHHDGFCMWDTKYNDYNIMNSPFKRDVMKELTEACRKEEIALGFYHSTCDWHNLDFPLTSPGGKVKRENSNLDRYTEYLKKQSVEIIKKYGPLLVMWYDVPQQFDSVRGQGVIDVIRKVQPDILVNDRTGAKGDFDTPEQYVGGFQNERPWETCMTIARQWAWKPNDEVKSLEQCLHSLIRCAGGDGNFLFNVGPKSDGTIEPLQVERLKEMGQWLEKYGYTIYGTRGGPFKPTDWGVSTRKGNKIYLHILKWVGTSPKIDLPDIGVEIKKCTLAGRGEATFSKKQNGWAIQFDGKLLQPVNTIVEIELDGNVMDIIPLDVVSQSLSFMKEVKASSESIPRWPACKSINNGDWVSNYWQPAKDDQTPWVEIDLGKPQRISKAFIYESGNNIKAFELLYKEGEKWKTIHKGATIGSKAEITFKPIESQFVKLVIDSFTDTPGIYKVILL
jgi:alpha-L-fucosidase